MYYYAAATKQQLILLSTGTLLCLLLSYKARGSEKGILSLVLISVTDSVYNIKQVK